MGRFIPCSSCLGGLAGLLLFLLALLSAGCDAPADAPAREPRGQEVRVASLVPAVTNMLLELDQAGKLVAVSNYDTDPRVAHLPRVGDLLTIDWEQIATVRPTHMIVQMSPEKTPPGAIERARELGVELVHVQLTRLDDITATLHQLQQELDTSAGSGAWSARFEQALPQRDQTEPLPTLIALSPSFEFAAGRQNYLDDLLVRAGGVNALPASIKQPYPRLDREALSSLRPKRIVLILPGATDAQLADARRTLAELEPAWGLTWDDVVLATDPYAIVPGWSVIDLAAKMAPPRAP